MHLPFACCVYVFMCRVYSYNLLFVIRFAELDPDEYDADPLLHMCSRGAENDLYVSNAQSRSDKKAGAQLRDVVAQGLLDKGAVVF
jgi:hypothetical protein